MSIFNPAVPNTNDPNWLGWSKAISQPGADSSTGELLSNVGTGIGEGVKFAAHAVDEGVKNIAYDATRKLQDEYTSALEKTDISVRIADAGSGVPTETTPAAGGIKSVYDAPPVDITPREIKQLPNDLSILDSARGNGKISATAYEGRLVALAKDLRARYPGQRDLIDQEIEKVSQRDVANKYATSLLGDINSFVNAGKEEQTKLRNTIIKMWEEGIPGADRIYAAAAAGQLGNPTEAMVKVMQWAGPAMINKERLKVMKTMREESEGRDKDLARDTEAEANQVLKGRTVNFFNAMHLTAGAPTFEEMAAAVRDANAGKYKLSEQQSEVFHRAIMTQKVEAEKDVDDYFNTIGKDGRSIVSILGTTKAEALKKFHLGRFDDVAKLIGSKDYGTAYARMNDIRAMGNDDQHTAMTEGDFAQYFRLARVIDTMKLDKASKDFFQAELGNLTAPKFSTWLKAAGAKMLTQPSSPEGVVDTLKQQIIDLKKRTAGATTPEITKTYDGLIKTIERIADPKTDVLEKQALAKAAFDPANFGLMTQFAEDSGSGPTYKPGKFSIYQRLYSTDMTRAVKALGDEYWQQYKDIAKQHFGRELFGPVLKDLTRLSTDYPGVRIGWDTESHQFKYTEVPAGREPFPADPQQKLLIKSKVDKINGALRPLSNIANEEKSDVDAYLLGVLKENGVDIGKLPGIPEQMMREIIRTREEEKTKTETFQERYSGSKPSSKSKPTSKSPGATDGRYPTAPGIRDQRLPYNIEDAPSSGSVGPQGASLSEFLRDPGRGVRERVQNAPAGSPPRSRGKSINLSDQDWQVNSVEEVGPNEDINKYLRRK